MTENNFIETTELEGVLIIERPVYEDARGFFRETFRKGELENAFGQKVDFVQANHSRSSKDSLRGIHIAPWHKLVTCTSGQVQQVVVDTRPGSPTFGKHISITMGEDNWRSVFIPEGCGNAFLVLSDIADYTYLTTDHWAPGKEKEVHFADSDVGIIWQTETPIVSDKDKHNPTLREVYPEKF